MHHQYCYLYAFLIHGLFVSGTSLKFRVRLSNLDSINTIWIDSYNKSVHGLYLRHPAGTSVLLSKMTIDLSVISYPLESMGDYLGGFFLEKSGNITSIPAPTLKIIIWFERYVCLDIYQNNL